MIINRIIRCKWIFMIGFSVARNELNPVCSHGADWYGYLRCRD